MANHYSLSHGHSLSSYVSSFPRFPLQQKVIWICGHVQTHLFFLKNDLDWTLDRIVFAFNSSEVPLGSLKSIFITQNMFIYYYFHLSSALYGLLNTILSHPEL